MKSIRYVAGLDAAYSKDPPMIFAAAVVMDFLSPERVEKALFMGECTYPYIPGKLFQREGEALLKAYARLKTGVDLVFVDGNGILHPEKAGIGAEIGRRLKVPTVGCAKSLLVGSHKPVENGRGSLQWIYYRGEIHGACLRTREGIKPLYVSIGFGLLLEEAIDITLRLSRFRLPEPIREAHRFAEEYKNSSMKS